MSEDSSSPLTDLQTPDEMALVFNSIGFGGRMEPEDAARFQQSAIASSVLIDAVPDQVRQNFERARRLHLYGVLEYQFFTAASDYALLVLESALRVRFLSYYDNGIPVSRRGQGETLNAESFEDVRRAPRSLQLRGSEGTYPLPLGVQALLGWARQERLLPGSETRRVDHPLGELRNYAAHPEGQTVLGPPDSARTLRDVAEVINTLWGHRVPGGRLFPAPVARVPRVAAIAPGGGGTAEMGLHHVAELAPPLPGTVFAVFLAAVEEKLTRREGEGWTFTFSPGLQRTLYPCERLWQGTYPELAAALEAGAFSDCADTVEHLDRLFFVRVKGEGIDEPRSAADLLGFAPSGGRWHAVVADSPYQALAHVKNHAGSTGEGTGSCPKCFIRTRGIFTDLAAAMALARSHGATD